MAYLQDADVGPSALHFQLCSSPSPTLLRTLGSRGLSVNWSSVAGAVQPAGSAVPGRIVQQSSSVLPPPGPAAAAGGPHHVPLPVLYLGKAYCAIPAGR